MTDSSSIFSFETLDKGSLRPSRAVLGAIVVVLALNIYAGRAWQRGEIFSSMPTGMLQECREKTREYRDVWLLGNSTLAKGIDETLLQELTEVKIAKMAFASATLTAQCQLAGHLLEETAQPPTQVWLFVTKDDLNANGARAEVSQQYLTAIESPDFSQRLSSYLPVHACRLSIRQKLARTIEAWGRAAHASLTDRNAKPSVHSATNRKKSFRDLGADFDTTYLTNLGRDYELDKGAFEELRQLDAHYPEMDWHVVLMPVTAAPESWQALYAPHLSWAAIKEELAEQLKGIAKLHDESDLLPGTSEFFVDAYHVNDMGRKNFSLQLAKTLVQ